jgi:hypothetical protein
VRGERATAVPAGWYPCPDGRGQRWWDGARWTDQWVASARTESLADAPSPGAQLRAALERGWRPPARPSLIALSSTEQVYAHASVEVLRLVAPEGAIDGYPPPSWQAVEHGTMHLTSFRFALQLAGQFTNVPYTAVADASCAEDGIHLWPRHQPPMKLQVVDPEWHYVLFRWLAYGEPRITAP